MIIEEISKLINTNNIIHIPLYYLTKPYTCIEILKDVIFDTIASSHENMVLISGGIVNCVQCNIIKAKVLDISSVISYTEIIK